MKQLWHLSPSLTKMTFSWSPERHGPQQTSPQGTGEGDGLSDLRARKQVQWHCWMKPGHGVGVREDFSWNTVALDLKKIMQNLVSKCKMLSLSSRALFRLFPLSYSRLAYCSSRGPYTEATSCRLRPPAPEAESCDPHERVQLPTITSLEKLPAYVSRCLAWM